MLQEQVIIKYAKIKKTLAFFVSLFILWAAFMLWKIANGTGGYIVAVIVSVAGIFSVYMSTKEMLKLNAIRLIINRDGLTDHKGTFYNWNVIDQEKIERSGEHTHRLCFKLQSHKTYDISIDVSELTETPEEIMALMIRYRALNASFPSQS